MSEDRLVGSLKFSGADNHPYPAWPHDAKERHRPKIHGRAAIHRTGANELAITYPFDANSAFQRRAVWAGRAAAEGDDKSTAHTDPVCERRGRWGPVDGAYSVSARTEERMQKADSI